MSDTGEKEAPVSAYERLYVEHDRSYYNLEASPYFPLFKASVAALVHSGARDVLEVGCGSGTLGEMVMAKGIGYHGFDYARTGVEKALRRNPAGKFAWGDATTAEPYAVPYDTILCCEVLEHIDKDREVIQHWRSGCNVVCSVPNFLDPTHVRLFKDEKEITARYGDLIEISSFQRLRNVPWRGLTPRQYFRRVRWAREEGWRKVLGMLNINGFDWGGGWFLFTGTRR